MKWYGKADSHNKNVISVHTCGTFNIVDVLSRDKNMYVCVRLKKFFRTRLEFFGSWRTHVRDLSNPAEIQSIQSYPLWNCPNFLCRGLGSSYCMALNTSLQLQFFHVRSLVLEIIRFFIHVIVLACKYVMLWLKSIMLAGLIKDNTKLIFLVLQ